MRRLTLTLLFLLPSLVMANGQSLHDAVCLHCHASLMSGEPNLIYSRSDRKVTSLEKLRQRVSACATAADAQWTVKQKSLVVDYLNKQFYLF